MIDVWVARRGTPTSPSLPTRSTAATRTDSPVGLSSSQMESVQRREQLQGDLDGRLRRARLGRRRTTLRLSAAETAAVARAAATGDLVVSRPERRRFGQITVARRENRSRDRANAARPDDGQSCSARTWTARSFRASAAPRRIAATTLHRSSSIPTDSSFLGLSFCPAPATTLCVVPTNDSLARLAGTQDRWLSGG